jgi:hypothetical protein
MNKWKRFGRNMKERREGCQKYKGVKERDYFA